MPKRLLIYGAGAIGRGFLPWVFPPSDYEYNYVEKNERLCHLLNDRRQFTTFRVVRNDYEECVVPIRQCYAPGGEQEAIARADAIIMAVGPRNASSLIEHLRGSVTPIICCENDASIPEMIRAATGNPNVVFAIPDVITSNTAPEGLLARDPLAIVTEDGVCYIDERVSHVGGLGSYVPRMELEKQWLAKLYLHNTPHCIAAYLGSMLSLTYVHEALKNPRVNEIVAGAMGEMKHVLRCRFSLEPAFVDWYADKELQRFRNTLLYDPIDRVAREPFRKLAPNERLIGAAQLCICCGIVPEKIMLGIMTAFCYDNPRDPDANIRYLMRALQPPEFLIVAMQLRSGEALYELLLDRWDANLNLLQEISDG